jgi:hypothetical protein
MKTNTVRNEETGRTILRLEALAVLAACLAAYQRLDGAWVPFLALFLLPDLSMVGYLRDARLGARLYNTMHNYALPLALCALFWLISGAVPSALWLVWPAHIAFDRSLGYGLKADAGFRFTHLGDLPFARGRERRSAWNKSSTSSGLAARYRDLTKAKGATVVDLQ